MTELALNILDIANNSLAAGAKHVDIAVTADTGHDLMEITLKDDGCGMDAEFLKNVIDPFATTRTTRRVGMGLPLFKMEAELTGGDFRIESKLDEGTEVYASFRLSHIDRPPLGDLAATVAVLVGGSPGVDFSLTYRRDGKEYRFDTAEIKEALGTEDISDRTTVSYLKEMLEENISKINGGITI